jgi:small subunit ribosomal protein S24e
MNLDIVNEKENNLLHRTEINARITFEKETPSRAEIVKLISAKKNVPENLVVVTNIRQEYGLRVAHADVRIYDSESAMKQIEKEYMIKRHQPPKKEGEGNE